ncbi:hypothetical protein CH275_02510 [Rhodococcus sp. 06-235-1A]|nr:hypothetical protein CH275_02510 [Rhodococcus sp. 06-235-1A]
MESTVLTAWPDTAESPTAQADHSIRAVLDQPNTTHGRTGSASVGPTVYDSRSARLDDVAL